MLRICRKRITKRVRLHILLLETALSLIVCERVLLLLVLEWITYIGWLVGLTGYEWVRLGLWWLCKIVLEWITLSLCKRIRVLLCIWGELESQFFWFLISILIHLRIWRIGKRWCSSDLLHFALIIRLFDKRRLDWLTWRSKKRAWLDIIISFEEWVLRYWLFFNFFLRLSRVCNREDCWSFYLWFALILIVFGWSSKKNLWIFCLFWFILLFLI